MIYIALASALTFLFLWFGSGGFREIWDRREWSEMILVALLLAFSLWGYSFLWRF